MMKKIIPLFTTLLLLGWSMNAPGPLPAKRPPGRRFPSAAGQPTSTLT